MEFHGIVAKKPQEYRPPCAESTCAQKHVKQDEIYVAFPSYSALCLAAARNAAFCPLLEYSYLQNVVCEHSSTLASTV